MDRDLKAKIFAYSITFLILIITIIKTRYFSNRKNEIISRLNFKTSKSSKSIRGILSIGYYGIYKGDEYKFSLVDKNMARLITTDSKAKKIGFKEKWKSVFIKIVPIDELTEINYIYNEGLYRGVRGRVIREIDTSKDLIRMFDIQYNKSNQQEKDNLIQKGFVEKTKYNLEKVIREKELDQIWEIREEYKLTYIGVDENGEKIYTLNRRDSNIKIEISLKKEAGITIKSINSFSASQETENEKSFLLLSFLNLLKARKNQIQIGTDVFKGDYSPTSVQSIKKEVLTEVEYQGKRYIGKKIEKQITLYSDNPQDIINGFIYKNSEYGMYEKKIDQTEL